MEHFGEDPLRGHHVVIDVKSAPSKKKNGEASPGRGKSETDSLKPLGAGKDGESYNSFYEEAGVDDDLKQEKASTGITDTMAYRTRSLTTWEAFSITYTTVWTSRELWIMMGKLSLVAACVACVTALVTPNPERLKVSKFTEVSKFLNVVVGLLLGFFMSSSMTRWHTCVNGFLELLDAIRNLQMQFVALGVPEKENNLCLRYGFASAWLLYGQLLVETKMGSSEQSVDRDVMWHKLNKKRFTIDRSSENELLKEWETKVLKMTRDPPGMMWMWVAAMIGRMAQDGWIPPMASPTYGRIMNLCQSAHGGIRQVRAAISVQAPLTYTHMLATLVHINNLLNAITFGLVSGLAIGVAMMNAGYHHWTSKEASNREEQQDFQNMGVTFMYCFFGPLLYQALLLISMHLAQPFDSEDAKIPLDRLLYQLEVDMCNGRDLVEHMDFEKPAFKKPT
jgi:predicted membrane chloride channel (bestrophin family)